MSYKSYLRSMYYLDGMARRNDADLRRMKREREVQQLQSYLLQDYLKRILVAAEDNVDVYELQTALEKIKKEALRSRLSDPDKVNVATLIDEALVLIREDGGRQQVISELRNVLYPQKQVKTTKRFGQRIGLQLFLVFITGGLWLFALPFIMINEAKISKKEKRLW